MIFDRLTIAVLSIFIQIGLGLIALIVGLCLGRSGIVTVSCGSAVIFVGILGIVGIYKVHRNLLISVLILNLFIDVILLELAVAFLLELRCLNDCGTVKVDCGYPSEIFSAVWMIVLFLGCLITPICQFRLICECCGGVINGDPEELGSEELDLSRLPYQELRSSYSVRRHKSSATSESQPAERRNIKELNMQP